MDWSSLLLLYGLMELPLVFSCVLFLGASPGKNGERTLYRTAGGVLFWLVVAPVVIVWSSTSFGWDRPMVEKLVIFTALGNWVVTLLAFGLRSAYN
jgi:hypothetical protein